MLKVLIKKQLLEIGDRLFRSTRKGQRKKNGKRHKGKGMLIFSLILVVYLLAMIAAGAWGVSGPLFKVGVGWLFYLVFGGAAILLGTIGSVFNTYTTLYLSKDNDLLLSMPIPLRDVILSRLLGVYITGLGYSAVVSLPAVVVGWIRGSVSAATLIGGLLWVLVLSLIVFGLSCLLGWVVARISQRLKNKSFITVLIGLVMIGLYYFVYFKTMGKIGDLLNNVLIIGGKIKSSLYPIYLFGRFPEGDWLAMLAWTGGVLLALALIWFLLQHSFLSVATSTPAGKHAVYREKKSKQTSVSSALLRREWYRFSGSATYMLNCGLGVVFLLAMPLAILFLPKQMPAELESVAQTMLPEEMKGVVPVFLGAVLAMLGSMVTITAPSVSLEGKTLWQIQSLPVEPWRILRAKLMLHLAVTAIPSLFCFLVITVLVPATLAQKLLVFGIDVLFTVFFALFGLMAGVKWANLGWKNETAAVKQSGTVAFSMLASMGLTIAFGGLYFWFGWRIGATAYLGIAALLLLAANAAMLAWLRGPGARRFEELSS